MESYKHLFAKKIVAAWIRDAWSATKDDGILWDSWLWTHRPFQMSAPQISFEYPICVDAENRSLGLAPMWNPASPPSYENCLENELFPLAIFDVVVFSGGQLRYAFEIKNTHEVGRDKEMFIRRILKEAPLAIIYEVSAAWIISRPARPKKIIAENTWIGPEAAQLNEDGYRI